MSQYDDIAAGKMCAAVLLTSTRYEEQITWALAHKAAMHNQLKRRFGIAVTHKDELIVKLCERKARQATVDRLRHQVFLAINEDDDLLQ